MSVIYIIKDYERLKKEYHSILGYEPKSIIERSGKSGTSDTTAMKAIKIAVISDKIKAIEQALFYLPEEYREGVMDDIAYQMWFPKNAAVSTYRYWKQRYVYEVAYKLNFT